MIQPPEAALDVVVAVVTYRRPERLADLLAALPPQLDELEQASRGDVRARILVVDNDPEQLAQAVAEGASSRPVQYEVQPEPGVSAARNAALDHAGTARLLVFIDDDELPRVHWLTALVRTWRETGATAVVGPVESDFEVEPDPWVHASGIHDREHRAGLTTGAEVSRAATNNLLLDLLEVERLGVRFDPRFGLTGGEDSMFSGTLVQRGGRIVWCAEAVVGDQVPADRLSRAYLIERTESLANASARAELALEHDDRARLTSRLRLVGTSVARWAFGGLLAVAGVLLRDLRRSARGHVHLARARGELRAAVGRELAPYAARD